MISAGSPNRIDAPAPDELEVSVFGPGYGESLAVHTGRSEWMIVDSCVDGEGRPPALVYLEAIGVDVAADVKMVVATHWHDDHVRGLAPTVAACESAQFACPVALRTSEFLTLTQADPSGVERTTSGVREVRRVLEIVRDRKKAGSSEAGPKLIAENQVIYEGDQCEVRALSPSSAAIERAMKAIADLLPSELRPHLRVSAPRENECSIALWVKGTAGVALLGADVEAASTDDRGWGAILALRPAASGRGYLVKVPHHGSESGHDDRMWEELLCESPAAILTPWSLGGTTLPSEQDCLRLRGLAPDGVVVGQAEVRSQKYDKPVERTIKEAAISRRPALGRMGHARARCRPASRNDWRIELMANAVPLAAAA